MKPPQVFISHITEEAPVAEALKVYLKQRFGEHLAVFVSSDYDSIRMGEEWYRAVVEGLLSAKAMIVLLSKDSVERPWINFEAGIGVGKQGQVIPLAIRNFPPGSVPLPLSHYHVRQLSQPLALHSLVTTLAEVLEAEPQPTSEEDLERFLAQLQKIEDTLPMKGIELTPYLEGADNLRMHIANTGNRDVELIEIEVIVPQRVLPYGPSFPKLPVGLHVESQTIGSEQYLIVRESPFDGALERGYGRRRFLPRII
jgi:hypothetical protein